MVDRTTADDVQTAAAELQDRARGMLYEAQGEFHDYRHAGRLSRLVAVLTDHPEAVVCVCSDENTGVRFGLAACRVGRCKKLGQTTYDRQFWASWAASDVPDA